MTKSNKTFLCHKCINLFKQKYIDTKLDYQVFKTFCLIDKENNITTVMECSHYSEISPSIDEIRDEVNKRYHVI